MRVGGPADLFATRRTTPFELRGLVRFARSARACRTLLGRGSDVVIADAGIRGLVVQDPRRGLAGRRASGYVAEAGVPMARAATETQKAGLSGLEFGLAIPGTVGGAVWANAGAHDGDVAGVLGSAGVLPRRRHARRARRSRSSGSPIATAASSTRPGRRPAGTRRWTRRSGSSRPTRRRSRRASTRSGRWRQAHQPLGSRRPAASSATRPATRPARLIEAAGLKGTPDRRRRRVREARQLHRQRPEGHRGRRPPPRGPGPRRGPRARTGSTLEPEIEFVGDWRGLGSAA